VKRNFFVDFVAAADAVQRVAAIAKILDGRISTQECDEKLPP
jgi:transaldolase